MTESKVAMIFRYILALALVFFGLNGFFGFMTPPEMAAAGTSFFGALFATGYMLPFMNIVFLVVAVMLLLNKWVPFALVLLAPIMVNVVLFHIFLEFSTGLFGFVVGFINLYLMIVHADSYRSMFHS